MADNVEFVSGANSTPAASTIVATDQIGSVHYQILKLALGPDGSASLLNIGQQSDNDSLPTVEAIQTTFDHGSKSNIGASIVQLSSSSISATRGVLVKASNNNTDTLYVGNNDVTAGDTDATDGFELGAGESVLVKVNNANKIYVIGAASGLQAFWVTV